MSTSGELSWAVVRDAEMLTAEAEKEAKDQRKKLPKCEEMIVEHSDKEKKLRTNKNEVEAEIQETAATFEGLGAREEELKREREVTAKTAKAAATAFDGTKRRRKKLVDEVRLLREEVARLRANSSEDEDKHKERRREMDRLEAQVGLRLAHLRNIGSMVDTRSWALVIVTFRVSFISI